MAAMLTPEPGAANVALLSGPELDPGDLDMAAPVRRARAAHRRADPEAWQRQLEALWHFDPDYAYDPGHEYDTDTTTDPDYNGDGVHLVEYGADGEPIPMEKRARTIQMAGGHTLSAIGAAGGLTGDYERSVRFTAAAIDRANRTYPGSGKRFSLNKSVKPDLMVRAELTPAERAQCMPGGVWRMDLGAPVPPLVMEILSRGGADTDLEDKWHLYAAAGIPEYFVYDLGGKRAAGSPRELIMFRLGADGVYVRQAPAEAYWSAVLGAWVRMQDDEREAAEAAADVPTEDRVPPRLQYLDPVAERWRDAESDRRRNDLALGREEGEANAAITALGLFLPTVLDAKTLAHIQAAWVAHGPPPQAMERIGEVAQHPDRWRMLLSPPAGEADNAEANAEGSESPPYNLL